METPIEKLIEKLESILEKISNMDESASTVASYSAYRTCFVLAKGLLKKEKDIDIQREEMLDSIKCALGIKELWEYPNDTKPEHLGEAEAVQLMLSRFQLIIEKHDNQ